MQTVRAIFFDLIMFGFFGAMMCVAFPSVVKSWTDGQAALKQVAALQATVAADAKALSDQGQSCTAQIKASKDSAAVIQRITRAQPHPASSDEQLMIPNEDLRKAILP